MIQYTKSIDGITPKMLFGFFVGWPNPPSPETHLEILKNSRYVVLAIDEQAGQVVGFITAISDGILSAYIPLLEVLPAHYGKGIGTELVKRMLAQCGNFYMVDTTCDATVAPFYARCGMRPSTGMMLRNYEKQPGKVDKRLQPRRLWAGRKLMDKAARQSHDVQGSQPLSLPILPALARKRWLC